MIDAVGMEAHGSPVGKLAQQIVGMLPDAVAAPMMQKAGVDRLGALYSAIDIVRRGGTISIIGVYGGMADPLPLMTLFDSATTIRWASIRSLLTSFRSKKRRMRTTSSRRSRTVRSRFC